MSTGIDAQVVTLSPRLQALVNALKQTDILRIIFSEDTPGLCITFHAPAPEICACIGDFAAAAQVAPEVVELIRVELESPAAQFKSVYSFEGRGRIVAVNGESRIDLLNVEGIPIVSYNDISRIKDTPELPRESGVVNFILLVNGVIRQAVGLHRFFAFPEQSKA